MGFLAPVAGWGARVDERTKRLAVTLHWAFKTKPIENRRHDINILGKVIDLRVGAAWIKVRVSDDQRDMIRGIKIAQFAKQMMVSHLFAMIRGEDDERVSHWPLAFKKSNNRPKLASTSVMRPK